MSQLTLENLAEKMRHIDFTMLFTRAEDGTAAGRPMSNNGDVEYDGESFFFAYDSARLVSDIERDPRVSMSLQGSKGLLGQPPLFIAVEGQAEVIRDKHAFAEHWQPELERWFQDGIDTAGMVMLKVGAQRIHWWNGEEEGEMLLRAAG